ncbi:MAG: RRXRR domain-containing protein, partial [Candidatus Paceibacterota bacterium]
TGCRQPGRMSAHTVYVLDINGKPLTPTTPAKARKLLKGEQARKVWSKFNTFGIQMLTEVRTETPDTVVGHDPGTKFEGYSVVVDVENNLNIKLDLPDKKKLVRKLTERREARRTRRSRLRRRPARFNNRSREGFIAPSQLMIVNSRLKVLKELCRIYPVNVAAIENVKFNHAKYRWGKNFSTVEIGKQKIRDWFKSKGIQIFEYLGFETAEIRKKYGYKKTGVKNADKFSAHCSDSLALAVESNIGDGIEPGPFFVIDDTYRCVRRKIHDSNIKLGGLREKYSSGTVFGIQKGSIIGTNKGKTGQLCGQDRDSFRYYDLTGKRKTVKSLIWISKQFKTKEVCDFTPTASRGVPVA